MAWVLVANTKVGVLSVLPNCVFFSSAMFLHSLTLQYVYFFKIIIGTILQEIKVDCDIDDRASIVINKKGKVWEVTLEEQTRKHE